MRRSWFRGAGLWVPLCLAGCIEQHPDWVGASGESSGEASAEASTEADAGSGGEASTSTSDASTSDASTSDTSTSDTSTSDTSTSDTGTSDTGDTGGTCTECPWWDDAWGFRSYLEADGSGIGSSVTGNPSLVTLDAERIDYAQAAANGRDLRFVTDDGTLLSHEIEAWNPGGSSLVWVRADLEGGTTTRVWMYYGNAAASDVSAPASVWTEYGGVWHLDDLSDATQKGHDGSSAGDLAGPGMIGTGRELDGLGAHVLVGQHMDLQYGDDMAMYLWFRVDSVDQDNFSNVLLAMSAPGEMAADNYLYGINLDPDGSIWTFWESSGALDVDTKTSVAPGWDDDAWHQVVVTRDTVNEVVTFYFDGQTLGSPVSYEWPPTGGSGTMLMLGADPVNPTSWNLDGAIDEVRVRPSLPSPAEIQFQYRAETDTLWTYGAVEPHP